MIRKLYQIRAGKKIGIDIGIGIDERGESGFETKWRSAPTGSGDGYSVVQDQ